MKQNIETFIGCDCEYEKAEIVLFGAPFDSTTSYRPGCPVRGHQRCAMKASGWKHTVRIRIKI